MATTESLAAEQRNVPAAVSKTSTVIALIQQAAPEIAKALPAHVKPERMARIAMTAVRLNPKLADCTPQSFLGALLTASQLGLEPNTPTGECYLVPYGQSVTLIVGYKGYIKLARQSGQIRSLSAHAVHRNDVFTFGYGSDSHLRHVPVMEGDAGPAYLWYAHASYSNGGEDFVVLNREEVEGYRKRGGSGRAGSRTTPWDTDYDAMACKTAIRRLQPYLPMSVEVTSLLAADEQVRVAVPGVTNLGDIHPLELSDPADVSTLEVVT